MKEDEDTAQEPQPTPVKKPIVLQGKYGAITLPKGPPASSRTKDGPGNLRDRALKAHASLKKFDPPKRPSPKNTKIPPEEIEGLALSLAYDAISATASPSCTEVEHIRRAVGELLGEKSIELKTETAAGKTFSYVELADLERLVKQASFPPSVAPSKAKFSFRYSISATTHKGRRPMNEDYFLVIEHFNELLGLAGPEQVYFGLYDGHLGKQAAEYCRTHLHVNIGRNEDFQHDIAQAMTKAFVQTDERYNDLAVRMGINDGTTAMAVFLREDTIIVANCGDARGFLYRGTETIPLCTYQNPTREDEKARIERAGGKIIPRGVPRVNGVLAVSRSIGDPELRTLVIAEPEVQTSPLTPGQDEFFVLATDGLWDVMSPSLVATFIRAAVATKGTEGVAQALVDDAINTHKAPDNVTVVVVFLYWP